MHAIDYGHVRDGVLYHATISTLDGTPKSTWTYERGGRKLTRDQAIDRATFEYLWNAIVGEDVFRRHKLRDRSRQIDPVNYHVLTIVFGDAQQPKKQAFLVPAEENDPTFKRWLETLNIPEDGSAEPDYGLEVQEDAGPALSEHGATPHATEREQVYPAMFGKDWQVLPGTADASGPAIDVYVFEPGGQTGEERGFYTLVTGGMSDARMNTPAGMNKRAELVLYVEEPTERHASMLQWLAQLPRLQSQTWYGPGTTMTNGQPPAPIFDGSALDCYFFMSPIVGSDDKLAERLTIEGDPVASLWVVPITKSECQLAIDRSPGALLELFDRFEHPFILDENRPSYVT